MTHDVFISYASNDKQIANAICSILEGRKIRCWIAPRDITPGMPWGEALVDAIGGCKIFVLVFSSNSNYSQQVMREVERAVSKAVTILPFRVEDVHISKQLEYFISSHHWLDALTPPLEAHINHLADTVSLLISRTKPIGMEPQRQSSAVSDTVLSASMLSENLETGPQAESVSTAKEVEKGAAGKETQNDELAILKEEEEICRRYGNMRGLEKNLFKQAIILRDLNDVNGALTLLEEQEKICRELDDRAELLANLEKQALIHYETRHDLERGLSLYRETEKISRETNDYAALVVCLINIAIILSGQGQQDPAMNAINEAEEISRKFNNMSELLSVLDAKGGILTERMKLDEAAQLYLELEQIAFRLNKDGDTARVLMNHAINMKNRGDLVGAIEKVDAALEIGRKIDDSHRIKVCLENKATWLELLGAQLFDREEWEGAIEAYRKQEEIERLSAGSDLSGLHRCLRNQRVSYRAQFNHYYTQERWDEAVPFLKAEERLLRELGDKELLRECLNYQIICVDMQASRLFEGKRYDEAMKLYKEEEALAGETENQEATQRSLGNQYAVLTNLFDTPLNEQRWDEALPFLREAESVVRKLGDAEKLQTALNYLAPCLANMAKSLVEEQHNHMEALALYKEAEDLYKETGNSEELLRNFQNQGVCHTSLGVRHFKNNEFKKALDYFKEAERCYRDAEDLSGLETSLANEAMILSQLNMLEGAIALYQEQEKICRQLGDNKRLKISLGCQIEQYWKLNKLEVTLPLYIEVCRLLRESDDNESLAAYMIDHAKVLNGMANRTGEALSIAEEAFALATRNHQNDLIEHHINPLLGSLRALFLRERALESFKTGDYTRAEELLNELLQTGFETASTHHHLARLCLISDRFNEGLEHVERAWAMRADAKPYILGRLVWLQLAFALLDESSFDNDRINLLLGRLKTVLQNDLAFMDWLMEPVLAHLLQKLAPEWHALLSALVAALSYKEKVRDLDLLPLWREVNPANLE